MKCPDLFTTGCAILGTGAILVILLGLAVLGSLQLAHPDEFIAAITDPVVLESIILTFSAAGGATILLAITGTPLAWVLARKEFPGKPVIEGLIDLPLIIPHTVAGIMVYLLFMHNGLLGAPFSAAGIRFEETFFGIMAAMLFVSIPYYVNTVREGFGQVPVRLEQVARSLGASPGRAFRYVTLPLSVRHLLTGGLIAWGRGVSEFAAVVMIAYHPMVIPTLIYQRFSTGGLYTATAVAFVMVLFSLLLFVIIRIAGSAMIGRQG